MSLQNNWHIRYKIKNCIKRHFAMVNMEANELVADAITAAPLQIWTSQGGNYRFFHGAQIVTADT
jgi:hypothetical protein